MSSPTTPPRSWRIRLIHGLIRALSRLSLRRAQALGAGLGTLAWRCGSDLRRVSEINLKLCFPEQDDASRQQLSKAALQQSGRTLAEIPLMWEWPVEHCLAQVQQVQGEALLDDALAYGKGLILLAPHLGNWELAGLYFSSRLSMAALYRPPKHAELEEYMIRVRGRVGSELVPTTKRGVMRLFSLLKDNGVVGILPDQEPDFTGGEFAPFFGTDANTIKLVSRLVSKTGARVLMTYARRLPDAAGFELVIRAPEPDIYSDDLLISMTAMNLSIEQCIRAVPDQYQWQYKRFKRRRPGEVHFYDVGRVW